MGDGDLDDILLQIGRTFLQEREPTLLGLFDEVINNEREVPILPNEGVGNMNTQTMGAAQAPRISADQARRIQETERLFRTRAGGDLVSPAFVNATYCSCLSTDQLNGSDRFDLLLYTLLDKIQDTMPGSYVETFMELGNALILVQTTSNHKVYLFPENRSRYIGFNILEGRIDDYGEGDRGMAGQARESLLHIPSGLVDDVINGTDWDEIDEDAHDWYNAIVENEIGFRMGDLMVENLRLPSFAQRVFRTNQGAPSLPYRGFFSLPQLSKVFYSTVLRRLIRHETTNMSTNEYFSTQSFDRKPWFVFNGEKQVFFLEPDFKSCVEYLMESGSSNFIEEGSEEMDSVRALLESKREDRIGYLKDYETYEAVRYAGRSDITQWVDASPARKGKLEDLLTKRDLTLFNDQFLFPSQWVAIMQSEQEGNLRWCKAYAQEAGDPETVNAINYIQQICNTAEIECAEWNFKKIFFDADNKIKNDTAYLNPIIFKDRESNEFLNFDESMLPEKRHKLTPREIDKVLEGLYDFVDMKAEEAQKKAEELRSSIAKNTLDLSKNAHALKQLQNSVGHYVEKDARERIRSSMKRIADSGAFTFEGYSDRNGGELAFKTVNPFIMKHVDKSGNKWKINVGSYLLRVVLKGFHVYLHRTDPSETPFLDYWQPYLPSSGVLCFGASETKKKNYYSQDDLFGLLMLVRDLMSSYDPTIPHYQIESYIEVQKQMDMALKKIKEEKIGKINSGSFNSFVDDFNLKWKSSPLPNAIMAIKDKKLIMGEAAQKFLNSNGGRLRSSPAIFANHSEVRFTAPTGLRVEYGPVNSDSAMSNPEQILREL